MAKAKGGGRLFVNVGHKGLNPEWKDTWQRKRRRQLDKELIDCQQAVEEHRVRLQAAISAGDEGRIGTRRLCMSLREDTLASVIKQLHDVQTLGWHAIVDDDAKGGDAT